MDAQVKDVLAQARDLLAKPGVWTRHTCARDASGERCATNNPGAVSFCAIGAIGYVTRDSDTGGFHDAVDMLQSAIDTTNDVGRTVSETNDCADDVAQVLSIFDRAIAMVEA